MRLFRRASRQRVRMSRNARLFVALWAGFWGFPLLDGSVEFGNSFTGWFICSLIVWVLDRIWTTNQRWRDAFSLWETEKEWREGQPRPSSDRPKRRSKDF
jgi:hypothetical protein